jgi:signal transduction histidine kinase
MTTRLALRFLAVFAVVLAALSAGAYEFLAREYASLLQPALATPEGAQAYAAAMRRVAWTIAAFDVPLLAIVGVASWLLARASIEPLLAAQERERIFAADAAHALRSPLATIASVAQAARGKSPRTDEPLDTIARAAVDASETVGELLTLARSAHADSLQHEPVDLGALAADTAKEFKDAAATREIAFRSDLHSAIVEGDERRLRELTRNLLDNALRHARSAVAISSRVDGNHVELIVENDGEPINPKIRARIFERFYRGDAAHSGTGLGLAIVQWIAHAHGGTAFVRDGERGLTQFVVRLPALPESRL